MTARRLIVLSMFFTLEGCHRVIARLAPVACPIDTLRKVGVAGADTPLKIDGPMLCEGVRPAELHRTLLEADPITNAPKIIARWDFSKEIETTRAVDVGPLKLHGELKQLPTRAMKGWNWTGEEHNWQRKPDHYGAIHFHHDDVYDAGWETSVAVKIPEDMPSGPYALHVSCGESGPEATRESYNAFFVRPPRLNHKVRGKQPDRITTAQAPDIDELRQLARLTN